MARGKNQTRVIQVQSAHRTDKECISFDELCNLVRESRRTPDMAGNSRKLTPEDLKAEKQILLDLATNDAVYLDGFEYATQQTTPPPDNLRKKNRVKDKFIDVQLKLDGPAENATAILEPELMIVGHNVSAINQPLSKQEHKKDGEDGFIEVQLKASEPSQNADEVLKSDSMADDQKVEDASEEVKEDGTKKDKKKKKKKNKKSKTNKKKAKLDTAAADKDPPNDTENDPENVIEMKGPVRLAPLKNVRAIQEVGNQTEDHVPAKIGCFGFISSWLVKRKEKRRSKKKQAIEARKSRSVDNLVVYDNRKARGGVAFTVEVDNRPINRTVLPPIRRRPGPIRMATEQKLENAESKREDQLNKKREAARAHSRLVRETADRRAQKEEAFKQTTLEKVLDKGNKAFTRLQHVRQEQRCRSRCASRIESSRRIADPFIWESPCDLDLSEKVN